MIKATTFKILLFIFLGLIPNVVYAISSPILLEPSSNSTISQVTLRWQDVEQASKYRVIVDDEPSMSTPYVKDYSPINTQYSPQLANGTYYWKVLTKDSTGASSTWSDIWTFNLESNPTTPAPTATPSSAPTPSASASVTNSSISSFIISNIPSTINSDQSFLADISINLPQSPNSSYYLKAAFKKTDSSNYFG